MNLTICVEICVYVCVVKDVKTTCSVICANFSEAK
jgi:hypothetical protein